MNKRTYETPNISIIMIDTHVTLNSSVIVDFPWKNQDNHNFIEE